MKNWPTDHPKANLMARKRAAILEAAKIAFLRDGYEGTSMDRIATDAGVSIMTLYRHAESKDKLFASVIATACHPVDESEQAKVNETLQKSLSEILVFVGLMFQDRIFSVTTIGLLRAVMMEKARHPHLAQVAYSGLIASHQDRLVTFLESHAETNTVELNELKKIVVAFFDHLVGIETFAILLGLDVTSNNIKLERANTATVKMMAKLHDSIRKIR